MMTHTVVMVELSNTDVQKFYNKMPCVIFRGTKTIDSCYILPPVRYPNGKVYIKVGHMNDAIDKRLHSQKEVVTIATVTTN